MGGNDGTDYGKCCAVRFCAVQGRAELLQDFCVAFV